MAAPYTPGTTKTKVCFTSAAGVQRMKDLLLFPQSAPHREANSLIDYLAGLAGGAYAGYMDVQVEGGNSKRANGGILNNTNVVPGDTFSINGVTFTAVASGAGNNQFNVGATDAITAANIAAAINTSTSVMVDTFVTAGSQGYVFTILSGNATAGATYVSQNESYTVTTTIAGGTTLTTSGSAQLVNNLPVNNDGIPVTGSGTLTLQSGTGDATITYTVIAPQYLFNVTSANATAGATYTNNSQTFTVLSSITAGTQLATTGTGAPLASGTLTLASGTGDATITFSSSGGMTGQTRTGSPYLKSAANYGIVSHSTITNTGNTVITGGLALSPGTSVTGFPPGTVSGPVDVADTAAAQAQIDANAAFTTLQTMGLAGTVIPSELGGQTLFPGSYQFASGSAGLSLTSGHSTLIFNGAGTYVIYTATTLTTGASGSTDFPVMTLTGGATAANIYFVVGSSATINQAVASAGAIFQGNVIASASVTAIQTGTINGSVIALGASVTLEAANNINIQMGSVGTGAVNLVAICKGLAGNMITLASGQSDIQVSGPYLTGGLDATPNTYVYGLAYDPTQPHCC
jgi:hypothetical protein